MKELDENYIILFKKDILNFLNQFVFNIRTTDIIIKSFIIKNKDSKEQTKVIGTTNCFTIADSKIISIVLTIIDEKFSPYQILISDNKATYKVLVSDIIGIAVKSDINKTLTFHLFSRLMLRIGKVFNRKK
jgi:hypothetical protein